MSRPNAKVVLEQNAALREQLAKTTKIAEDALEKAAHFTETDAHLRKTLDEVTKNGAEWRDLAKENGNKATMIDVYAALSDDTKAAIIGLTDADGNSIGHHVLGPVELSTLIENLGRLRAAMFDKIPRKLEPEPGPVFRVTREAVFHVGREHVVAKEFFLACLHPGYGWQAFALTAETGTILMSLLDKQIKAISPITTPEKPKLII